MLNDQASAVAARVIRPDVRGLQGYDVVPSAGMIKLDAMENPFGLPVALRAALGEALAAVALNRYPIQPMPRLLERLRIAGQIPSHLEVVLGNGSDELIDLIIRACCQPGDVVLSPAPSFVMYGVNAAFNHARHVGVPLDARFQLDVPAMLDAMAQHQPKVVFLAYPNNPTGALWHDTAIEAVVRAAPGLVVIDEAYHPFARRSWLPRLTAQSPYGNLLVLRTLSKLGLAGLRLGYLSGPRAWLHEIDKLRPPYNINALTQCAAEIVLTHPQALDDQAAQLCIERERMIAALSMLDGVQVYPSDANFVLFRVGDPAACYRGLCERNILIRDVSRSDPLLAGCLRVSVGTPDDNQQFLTSLRTVLQSLQRPISTPTEKG